MPAGAAEGVVEATLVSIVVPISDKHAYDDIDTAVHSALAQTHRKIELLLIDGAAGVPAARLRQLAAGDPRVRVIVSPETGVWGALNWGIGTAAGDYLALLVPGDTFTPHKIAMQLRAMQQRGELFSYTSTTDLNEFAEPAERAGLRCRNRRALSIDFRAAAVVALDRDAAPLCHQRGLRIREGAGGRPAGLGLDRTPLFGARRAGPPDRTSRTGESGAALDAA